MIERSEFYSPNQMRLEDLSTYKVSMLHISNPLIWTKPSWWLIDDSLFELKSPICFELPAYDEFDLCITTKEPYSMVRYFDNIILPLRI